MRAVTWNLDWWNRHRGGDAKRDLLETVTPDLTLLQEVASTSARKLRESCGGPAVFSQELHPEATWRWMGCGVLTGEGCSLLDVGLVEDLPKPQRGLWASIDVRGAQVIAVSWHTPNAAGDGVATKMAAYDAMTRWLERVEGPVILGCDLNTWIDPVDLQPADEVDPFFEEHAFVGPNPSHGLRDGYRQLLEDNGELADMRTTRPNGPLATSYVLKRGTPHRMDRIYVSPDFDVVDGRYLYEEARAAGSDHALHWLDLRTR